jgi:hypothetical protein
MGQAPDRYGLIKKGLTKTEMPVSDRASMVTFQSLGSATTAQQSPLDAPAYGVHLPLLEGMCKTVMCVSIDALAARHSAYVRKA